MSGVRFSHEGFHDPRPTAITGTLACSSSCHGRTSPSRADDLGARDDEADPPQTRLPGGDRDDRTQVELCGAVPHVDGQVVQPGRRQRSRCQRQAGGARGGLDPAQRDARRQPPREHRRLGKLRTDRLDRHGRHERIGRVVTQQVADDAVGDAQGAAGERRFAVHLQQGEAEQRRGARQPAACLGGQQRGPAQLQGQSHRRTRAPALTPQQGERLPDVGVEVGRAAHLEERDVERVQAEDRREVGQPVLAGRRRLAIDPVIGRQDVEQLVELLLPPRDGGVASVRSRASTLTCFTDGCHDIVERPVHPHHSLSRPMSDCRRIERQRSVPTTMT